TCALPILMTIDSATAEGQLENMSLKLAGSIVIIVSPFGFPVARAAAAHPGCPSAACASAAGPPAGRRGRPSARRAHHRRGLGAQGDGPVGGADAQKRVAVAQ